MKKKTTYENYELSSLTMLVTPQFDDFGNVYAKVIEEDQDIIIRKSPLQIIEVACEYFGSDLRGRQRATEVIANYTYKLPIAIEPYNNIYFFPTASPTTLTCSWLSHSHILRIYQLSSKQSEIIFNNGRRYTLDVSKHSLTNQLHRTAQLRYLIEQRIKDPKVDFHYPPLSLVADPKRYFRPFS
ncbi:MAG TPA: competence protein ComK [Bacillota bacterium]|nr:competence protein ComK [Bacillota bacterium]